MAIPTINKMYAKDEGESEGILCPECGKAVCMRLFSSVDVSPVTLFKQIDGSMSIAVCPECAAVFDLSKNYLKEKTAGTTVFLTENDLKVRIKGK